MRQAERVRMRRVLLGFGFCLPRRLALCVCVCRLFGLRVLFSYLIPIVQELPYGFTQAGSRRSDPPLFSLNG